MKKIVSIFIFVFLMSLCSQSFAAGKAPAKPLRKAPELPEKAIWLNVPKDKKFRNFKGKVTLIEFWDYSSINSIRNLAYLKKWQELYGPLGLRIIGIHSPDYDFAYKKENLAAAMKRLGIDYPVLMDNDFKVWKDYQVFSWPTQFIIDHKGKIVHRQIGEGHYREVEEQIRKFLSLANRKAHFPPLAASKDYQDLFDTTFCGSMSEEIRIGSGKGYSLRGPIITNIEGFQKGKVVSYEDMGRREPQGFFVQGHWMNYEDHFEHANSTEHLEDYLGIVFEGYEVYSVLNSDRLEPVRVYLLLDSKPIDISQSGKDISRDEDGKTYVMVDEPRLYYLLSDMSAGPHELKLYTQDEGASIYGFSFGNSCLTDFDRV